MGIPYTILFPIFARDILGGGAGTLGLLTSAAGLGALGGSPLPGFTGRGLGAGRVIARSTVLFGVSLAGFALSRDVWISCLFLVGSGFGIMLTTASINTVLRPWWTRG